LVPLLLNVVETAEQFKMKLLPSVLSLFCLLPMAAGFLGSSVVTTRRMAAAALAPLKVRLVVVVAGTTNPQVYWTCSTSARTNVLAFPRLLVSIAHPSLLPDHLLSRLLPNKAAESEVSFEKLDGSKMRIGIIRTRWNNEHVSNLVNGVRQGLKECSVSSENIFETSVPGSFELPLAARFLALSGTVDAIITVGVLIKGETLHFEYISEAVSAGLMSTGLATSTPIVFGVLTCLNEAQVKARSTGSSNHGVDWGKTAVEMALLRTEALGGKTETEAKLEKLGFGSAAKALNEERKKPAFF
jgi:6,7-dimethyl-8-ribityllumazine synthase